MRAVWNIIVGAYLWLLAGLRSLFRGRKREVPWRFERVEDLPDRPQTGLVYLAGEGESLWGASMLCPCGCGEIIEMNLLPQVRPHWKAVESPDGRATLSPSVWRQMGCKSHFFVRNGRIEWR